ncbi:MAG: hypothetical protein JWO89_3228 [Verrucomicrobiaceae bacterium]|nr:hypothetical protein [Verrucomicrobiaceae bacterium]MDB6119883.1 hypothetical protein [Verrucomicrobiaceae bacterium]
MAATYTPSVDRLKRALKISEEIEILKNELLAVLGGSGEAKAKRTYTKRAAGATRTKKRVMSPEAREKIAAAQRKRWAKQKKK